MSVLERVRATGLLAGPLVVLLSGGRDSTCLLDVVVRLGVDVRALHVDYGLRGTSSEADREHCVALCAGLGVELELQHAEPRPADAPGNLHAWARDVRYAAGTRAVTALGPDARRAAGHTISDQVETVLYRLATSPGRRA